MMGADSVRYHQATVMDRADDHPGAAMAYYAERGESPLSWHGGGAARLGLAGAVTPEAYEDLFGPGGARHPLTGERLAATQRPGMELVVSVHKTVAELGVIGRAEDMHRILDAERGGTMAYLEALTVERGGRRGRAAFPTPTSGLVYAVTRHATSRAGDPCLHDHVLVANVVEMLDARGGWKAADTALWREHLHAATAWGRVCSAQVAVELGYGIVPDDGPSGRLGHWAIAGVPEAAVAVHSKRAAAIDDALGGVASGSYRERAIAARKTRPRKESTPVEDLVAGWRRELAEVGLEPARVDASIVAHNRDRIVLDPGEEGIESLARWLLRNDGPLADRKIFTRRDVIVAAAPQVFGLDPGFLDRVADRVLEHPLAIRLEPLPGRHEPVWAPQSVVLTELAIHERAMTRHAGHRWEPLPVRAVAPAIAAGERRLPDGLTAGQLNAVVGICGSGRSLDVVVGQAGTGKTTTLALIRQAHEQQGVRVVGTATSGQAARTVGREAGMESFTVASLLARLERGTVTLDARTLVVLDEAGMTDDSELLRLLNRTADAGAKFVLVGDPRQLSAVGPGGSLDALVGRFGGKIWELTDNVRQVDLDEREVLAELRHGDVEVAARWYARNGRLVLGQDRAEMIGAVVDGWITDLNRGNQSLMLAWRRDTVDQLNHLGRRAFDEQGRLTGPELEAPGGRCYRTGDRVVALAPLVGVPTSTTGIVNGVDMHAGSITVHFHGVGTVELPYELTGSRCLDHGYAVTVHRSQGATLARTHYIEEGGGRELAYVGMSRAREKAMVYRVADSLDQALEDLTSVWALERRQEWVIDRTRPDVEPPMRAPQREAPVVESPSVADDFGLGL